MLLPYEFTAEALLKEGRTSRKALGEIKSWLEEERERNAIIPEDIPDELLVLFLISCGNVVEATKNTIRAYFKVKKEAPEMFDDRDIDKDDLKMASNTVYSISMPKRMDDNTIIHFFKINDTYYGNFHLIPIMKIAYMLVDLSQRKDPPENLVVVIDMKGVGLMHLTRFKLGPIRSFFHFLQEGMQLKLKCIHILNANFMFNKILALIQVFMKSDLLGLLHVHSPGIDMEQFYKDHIPACYLPEEYGGGCPSTEKLNNDMIEKFRDLIPFFEAEEKMRKCSFS